MKTLYDILEVSRQASAESIDAAFRRLIADCDRVAVLAPGPELEMRKDAIVRAHAQLADPRQRRDYDERLALADSAGLGRPLADPDGAVGGLARRVALPLAFGAGLGMLLYLFVGWLTPPAPPTAASAPVVPIGRATSSAGPLALSLEPSVAERRLEYERAAREQAMMLERERAAREQSLTLERERLRLEVEILRAEADRRNRELEQHADAEDRRLKMEERRLAREEADAKAADETRDYWEQERRNLYRIRRNVENAERALELRKDAAAARLGITRDQYDRLQERRWTEESSDWTESSGWYQ